MTLSIPTTTDEAAALVKALLENRLAREAHVLLRDKAVADAARPFVGDITAADELEAAMLAALENWAITTDAIPDGETITLDGSRVGWEQGKLSTTVREGLDWDGVTGLLQAAIGKGKQPGASIGTVQKALWAEAFLRHKLEANKAAMLEHASKEGMPELLAEFGVELERKETFVVKPARDGQKGKRMAKTKVGATVPELPDAA